MGWRDAVRGARGAKRVLLVTAAVLLSLVLLLVVGSFVVDRPLRGWVERRMNQQLKGYQVSVPRVQFSLWTQ